jgi:hypothetical protein
MIHPRRGNPPRVKGAASFAYAGLFGFFIGGPSGPASAGEFDRSTLPAVAGPAQCDSRGDGPSLLKDSGECKRISGYIAAGARFGTDERIGGRRSPFGPLGAPEFVGSVRPSGATIIDAPAGQDRFFMPPGPGDEAR